MVSRFSSFNKGFKYILKVIDVFSKYARAVPINDKSAASVTKTFEKIINDRIPKTLWVNEGKEFYNATIKKLFNKYKIDMYSTFNEEKIVVIERFNRTLKNIMWKYFTTNNTRFYLDALDQMVKNYNDKVHSTIKMRGARWLSGGVSDSGARGRGFDTYRRRVVSLSKTLYSPKVLVNYPGSGGSVPT